MRRGTGRSAPAGNPFHPAEDAAYRRWRDRKLESAPARIDELVVEVSDLADPSPAERNAVLAACRRANMAVYACRNAPQGSALTVAMTSFAGRFGLRRMDTHLLGNGGGFTALRVAEGGRRSGYIPYTDRALSWHTDGYYNPPGAQIRAVFLHCASTAADGGENALLDHEIAYIRLRDEDPELVAALMHPQAMTIPANREGGAEIRPARSGPVFSIDPPTGALHMRYTARTRSIAWRDDAMTRAAREFLTKLLSGAEPLVLRHRFAPGEGLICNNVLHNRSGFRDDTARGRNRLVWRARYLDRVGAATAAQPAITDEVNA